MKIHNAQPKKSIEYAKFTGVLTATFVAGWVLARQTYLDFLPAFMGVFFILFASFKLYNLKEFAHSFQSYEIIKDKPLWWGYAYPFIQLLFGGLYLLGFDSLLLDAIVFLWSAYGAYIVLLTLRSKGDIYCVCLGNVIKLPLSHISFVEDFGMALMALIMILL